jgi:hypothetical protein
MSSSKPSISSRGEIENLQHLGFTLVDALSELIDNSLDAHAARIRIRMDSSSSTLFVDDDGDGMDLSTLGAALRFHNIKEASDSIGLRGVGMKAGHAVPSNARYPTYIFSKTSGGDAVEACADWPGAIEKDMWSPTPADLSGKRTPIWDAGALNPDHGTVAMIPMPPERFAALKASVPELRKDLGRTFDRYMRNGRHITVVVDGEEHSLDTSTAMGWEEAEHKHSVPIDILHNPATEEVRMYFQHTSGRPIYTEMVRKDPADPRRKKILREYAQDLANGFEVRAHCELRSAYKPEWNGTAGYLTPCRGDRHLRCLMTEMPNSGDHDERKVVASSRHEFCFTHEADGFIGIQVNKSDVTPENIRPEILAPLKDLGRTWSKTVYKTHYKKAPASGVAAELEKEIKRTLKEFKKILNRRPLEVLTKFETWLTTLDEEEDSEDSEDEEV